MAFTAKSNGNSNRVEQPVLDAGSYPARLVKVATYGLQAQRPYQGQDKKPAEEFALTFELVDAFMIDEAGEELEDKPRWISIRMPFYSLDADRAKSTIFYNAFDPERKFGGDWSKLIGQPVNVAIGEYVKDGKRKNNVLGLTRIRPAEAKKMPDLKNPPILFDFDDPDMEIFGKLPQFEQEIIKGSLRFAGSPLEKALKGGAKAAPKQAPEPETEESEDEESDDNEPW